LCFFAYWIQWSFYKSIKFVDSNFNGFFFYIFVLKLQSYVNLVNYRSFVLERKNLKVQFLCKCLCLPQLLQTLYDVSTICWNSLDNMHFKFIMINPLGHFCFYKILIVFFLFKWLYIPYKLYKLHQVIASFRWEHFTHCHENSKWN
jgi:hypothetical protein